MNQIKDKLDELDKPDFVDYVQQRRYDQRGIDW